MVGGSVGRPRHPSNRVLKVDACRRDVPRQASYKDNEEQSMSEHEVFTMQAADEIELEQVEGGLVLTDGPIYALKSSPGADGYFIQ